MTDPLEDAAPGETVRVVESKELHEVNYTPRVYFGTDRDASDIELANAEIVDGDDGEGQMIRLTWEGDVTKTVPRLPAWWDDGLGFDPDDGTVASERPTPLRWQAVKAGVLAAPFVIATGVTEFLMRSISGEMSINGEPMVYVPWTIVIVMTLVMMAFLAIREIPPLKNGGRAA